MDNRRLITIVVVAVLVAVAWNAFANSSTQSFPSRTAQVPNVKNRKQLGMKPSADPAGYKRTTGQVQFGRSGNLLWYGAVDPNLMQVAGSGALY